MKKYKVTVYAICKNEVKNVAAWYESMQEADEIVVLDTGSEDNTIEELKKYPKIKLYCQEINPWRFDVARNLSLSYVSVDTDICVCTDLDERFQKGWYKNLIENWQDDTTRASYLYNWSFDSFGKPAITFYLNKIHSRQNYKWVNAVHEILESSKKEKEIILDKVILNHYQDTSKSRQSYLPLLELSVKENPENDRNMHYLAREYMYYHKWDQAIETFHKHLKLKSATWKDERCASMRYMANCYFQKNYLEEAILWYKQAILECPNLREPYYDLAYLYHTLNEYHKSNKYLKKLLKIKKRQYTYIQNENAWNETVYDILSLNYYNLQNYSESYKYVKKALNLNSLNPRLKNNYLIIKEKYLKEKELN